MKSTIIIALILFLASSTYSQTRVVYGQLTAYNKYPLQNIEVKTKKSKAAVKSDSLGLFSIVCQENDVIRIRPKAFQSVSRKVGPDTDTLLINLVFINSRANRELATGYGYINQQDLSYAVSHLEQENNEFCNYENIFELIRGRFPGVTVSRNNYGGAIYVRGATSINMSSEALYVVDGGVTSNIDWIHPCDIRSIDVLKDGMTAIYGSRGASGVVVIETKRGQK
ncbi:MAG: TonB-dependent receptor plug domain-containing protein [Bacteroidales bacterium]|nr:TonB-dependent receptor plug domain-containing protein [Bacteroidales bacterium]